MRRTVVDDGFASYLVQNANFDSKWEIPIIKNEEFEVPEDIIPFDKINRINKLQREKTFVHFYMHDISFRKLITSTNKYVKDFRDFGGIISPDFSLYIDMPLCLQLANTYLNRAVGVYMQNNGVKVIPNVRWGDTRTFDFCFSGLEKGGLYSISTHGCIKGFENKKRFKEGLSEMIKKLKPKSIIVNGSMPEDVFSSYINNVDFINYEAWISRVMKGKSDGNK